MAEKSATPEARKRLYGSPVLAVARLPGGKQVVDDSMNVETDDLCNVEKLYDIDAATPALDLGNDGLVSAKFCRKLSLTQLGVIALLDNEVDEADVSG